MVSQIGQQGVSAMAVHKVALTWTICKQIKGCALIPHQLTVVGLTEAKNIKVKLKLKVKLKVKFKHKVI